MDNVLCSIFSRNMDDTLASLILLSKKYSHEVIVFDDNSKDGPHIHVRMVRSSFVFNGIMLHSVNRISSMILKVMLE